jgi:2-keto-4-pentenoate hydratase
VLRRAQDDGEPCAPLSERAEEREEELGVEEAYAIQRLNIEHRVEEVGLHGVPAHHVGRKIGLTSRAIQEWLGVVEPDFGVLLDDMYVPTGTVVDTDLLLQPRAEAEIAFVLGESLEGPGVTAAQVLGATDFVLPAIEIIDSRVANWEISYVDTIADNASSGMFVLGAEPVELDGLALELAGMALRKDDEVVSTGAGIACLSHPVNAVVWLANKLAAFGEPLRAGEIVLSGALGPAVPVEAGDWVEADIARVGSCSARFV